MSQNNRDGNLVVPGGLFDLQINGGWGHHFSDDPSSIWAVGGRLVECGVTRFLPTLVSSGFARIGEALEVLRDGPPTGYVGARPLGWHLEGPWFNPVKAGAHDLEAIHPSNERDREGLTVSAGVRMITLAPEVEGGLEAIRTLSARGIVVSMGHSDATVVEATEGVLAGAQMGTHLFNAMRGLHHREPGLAATLLTDERVSPSMIVDGHHVAPEMVSLAWQLAGARLIIVSDAVSALGLTDDPVARLADGTLAGATVGLDQGIRNLRAFTGCSLAQAAAAASVRPSNVLGVGAHDDDLVVLDADGLVIRTEIAGKLVFER